MYPAMMRSSGFAFFLSIVLVSTAVAQTATPTTGTVGSATLRNGFPAGGGAVALPSVQNSAAATSTPAAGTTTTPSSTNSTTGTTGAGGSNSTSSGASGQTGGGGGGGASRGGGGGSTSTAGTATATGSSGNGTFVLCPPSGAPGLEPLFIGTDLSCAPQ